MNKYFNEDTTIYDLVTKYPDLLDLLVNKGFTPLKIPAMFNTIAKVTKISQACELKNINYALLEEQIVAFIENKMDNEDSLLSQKQDLTKADFVVKGILPCPIRVPLIEKITTLEDVKKEPEAVGFDLRAGSGGIDFLEEDILSNEIDARADVFASIGFKLFFEKKFTDILFGKDEYGIVNPEFNKDFQNESIDLRDPKNRFYIYSVVPCVFLINTDAIGNRVCESWDDILKPEFAGSVSVPMQDLDMFNALCLSVYSKYGYDGIKNLKRSCTTNLHPAEMVKKSSMPKPCAVNIIPYFFGTIATKKNPNVEMVWPKEGAIASPIFLTAKKSKPEQVEKVLAQLADPEMCAILSADGCFPLTNKNVENNLSEGQKFIWVGWDFIYNEDIGKILNQCELIFKGISLG